MRKIGDKIDTMAFGKVTITDIFVKVNIPASMHIEDITNERIYRVASAECDIYLANEVDLEPVEAEV
jgi:hypothetical protein